MTIKNDLLNYMESLDSCLETVSTSGGFEFIARVFHGEQVIGFISDQTGESPSTLESPCSITLYLDGWEWRKLIQIFYPNAKAAIDSLANMHEFDCDKPLPGSNPKD